MLKRTILGALTVALAAGFVLATTQANAANDRFKKVLERGKLVVGVKADYKPWGFRDSDGNIVGMEADMAQDVADALGVELELVPVQSSNRMQFLEQGKIDLMIATMSDRSDRRKIVGIVEPNYYTSGTNLLAKKGVVKEWTDLKDKPVCGKQGAFYNKIVAKRYGAKVVAFVNNAEAKQALRDGKCVGWVYDDSSIGSDLASGEWDGFEMPLNSEDDNPWGLAVPVEEVDSVWGNFMAGMSYRWLVSGRLIELEKKWEIQPTQFLKMQQEKLTPARARALEVAYR
jgi:polar amino acid transport system substrate-binding protein